MRTFLALLTLLVGLAACGDDSADGDSADDDSASSAKTVTAIGALFDDGSGLMLCSELMESFPPQCGGGIPLDNPDDVDLGAMTTAEGISWTD